ncbi:OmpA family protein [Granulosicoccus sp.]|nr:OmpA family protein [Granulosicoccus sp.]MDB4224108.1 OmpA family protein [Granulosicoccus sp.]
MNTRTTLALGACLSLVSLGASAHSAVDGSVEASGGSYISSGGSVIKTGLGGCLQSGTFSADDAINACEGIADEAAEVVAEAPAAPAATPAQTSKIDTREFSEQTLFDTDSAQLNASGLSVMNGLFSALSEYKGITGISVTGHTDSRGSEAYNQALSEQRAQTVADQVSSRYPDARIDVIGMGESSPIASNVSAEGRQLNRRVDVEVTATRMVFN